MLSAFSIIENCLDNPTFQYNVTTTTNLRLFIKQLNGDLILVLPITSLKNDYASELSSRLYPSNRTFQTSMTMFLYTN
jgi:hypothetical protein